MMKGFNTTTLQISYEHRSRYPERFKKVEIKMQ